MNNRKKVSTITVIIALMDIVLLSVGYALAFLFGFDFRPPLVNVEPYKELIPWLAISVVIIFYLFNMYTEWRSKSVDQVVYSTAVSIVTYSLVAGFLAFWYWGFSFPRTVIILGAIMQFMLIALFRWVLVVLHNRLISAKNLLVISTSIDDESEILHKLNLNGKKYSNVFTYITESGVESFENLENTFIQADCVLISPNVQNKVEIVIKCIRYKKEALIIPELMELMTIGSTYQQIDDMMVLSIQSPSLSFGQRVVKRGIDILISLSLLVIFSPILILLWFIIPLTSSGPAIFRQERLGLDWNDFMIMKFRSMADNAEIQTGPIMASKYTTIGRFIRTTRLDEFPQLINVLKGEMSIVGPRPEEGFFVKQYRASKPYYDFRMAVKPGITGLAQVMAKYSTSMEDKLRFDLFYINNYSLFLDIRILFQTIKVIFKGGV